MKKAEQRRELWRERIAQQETSGQSIPTYCRKRRLKEHAFYWWRRRLREQSTAVRFALVEAKRAEETVAPIELVLSSGDLLRTPHNAATLKLVLAVLREQS